MGIKIEKTPEEWIVIAEALERHGKAEKDPHVLRAAASVYSVLGYSATRNSIDAEADRLQQAS